jgi:ABC transporter substrate binding protein
MARRMEQTCLPRCLAAPSWQSRLAASSPRRSSPRGSGGEGVPGSGSSVTPPRLWRLTTSSGRSARGFASVAITAGTPAALAVKRMTTTIPLVVSAVGGPIGTGLVKSLARPGGNLTGLAAIAYNELMQVGG